MDCNYTNQRRSQLGCPQFPEGTGQNCGCNAGMPPLRPPVIQPRQAVEPARSAMPSASMPSASMPSASMPSASMPSVSRPSACPDTSVGGMERYSLAMAYVPWQQWKQTYAIDRGLQRGTIFPELDLPFVMGRCR